MGFDSFREDPKAYLGHHRVMIQDAPPSALASVAGPAVALANGKDSMLFTQSPVNFITMIHTVGFGAPIHSSGWTAFAAGVRITGRIYRPFKPHPSIADVGFRYLPFRADHCTYMSLDAAATFFITGPLTGCTVAVSRHAGAVWVFHSNDNVGAGVAARATQRGSLMHVCAALNVPVTSLSLCEYQTHYNGFGFVFGRLRGGVWKFYTHATDANNNTRTRKWAEV